MADSSLPQKDDETDDAPIAGAKAPIINRSPRQGSSAFIRDLKVETVQVSVLKPYSSNPRTHSKKQLRQIADSIRLFGWTNPILVDADGGLLRAMAGLRRRGFSGLIAYRRSALGI
jgi:ParB/Sulfiredoxin domain